MEIKCDTECDEGEDRKHKHRSQNMGLGGTSDDLMMMAG